MAKESSVAPKERINIVYKPATGGAQEEIELPLVQLVLGDFTLRPDGRPLEERGEPINVDKDNFNKVMREQKLELNFTVPNRLSEQEGDELPVGLRIENLKDFGPESVAAQMPELKKLTELRDALTALKGPLANIPGFRKQLQQLLQDDAARERLIKELGMETDKKE
jgi:type VI secretion system protein ImpB